MVVVVMGVCGCGKTVVGEAVASLLGTRFIEGDRLHPPENVALMSKGLPLTDADRWGWLDAVGASVARAGDGGGAILVACSALKRIYRDRLRRFLGDAVFVHLAVDPKTAALRVAGRKGHYMPASLVESQFAILEPPASDERALTLDAARPIADLAAAIVAFLATDEPGRVAALR